MTWAEYTGWKIGGHCRQCTSLTHFYIIDPRLQLGVEAGRCPPFNFSPIWEEGKNVNFIRGWEEVPISGVQSHQHDFIYSRKLPQWQTTQVSIEEENNFSHRESKNIATEISNIEKQRAHEMYLRLIYYYVDEDKMEQPTNANTRCESNLHIKDYQYYLLNADTNIKSIFINFCNEIKTKMNIIRWIHWGRSIISEWSDSWKCQLFFRIDWCKMMAQQNPKGIQEDLV